jgi:acyl-CoA thioester hydrolase
MDHMNVQWYTAKFDEATWHLVSFVGITNKYIHDNQRGMAALEQITKYESEVIAGDLLVIKSKILEIKDKTIRFLHIMFNAETGKRVASSELLGVHLDRVKRKSCPFPEHIKAKCEALVV